MLGRRAFVMAGTWALMPSVASAAELLATTRPHVVDLSEQHSRVVLQPQRDGLFAYLEEIASQRITLVCRQPSAHKRPGSSFLLFLNAGEDGHPTSQDVGFVGALSMFGGASRGGELQWPTASFEISAVLEALRRAGRLNPPLSITFVATRKPEPDSRPKVEQVDIFSI